MTEKKGHETGEKTLSRRDFLKKAGLVGAGALVGATGLGSLVIPDKDRVQQETVGDETFAFHGRHQAGIISPTQKNVYFVVLDLATTDKSKVIDTLKDWTAYTKNLVQGKNVATESSNGHLPPKDTGETDGLNPYRLTVTFGISAQFLDKLGLSGERMTAFRDLPPFPGEQLEDKYQGGDIMIQACADDEQVAFHAIRNLIRVARGNVTLRWSQSGFTAIGNRKETPRNLFGFKDGTANPTTEAAYKETIWYDGNDWLKDGTFMVVRRVRMHLETWDRTSLNEQENTFGRYKHSGAPFGKTHEFDTFDVEEKDSKGQHIMPVDSHVSLAHKTGVTMHRRSYSYSDGINDKTGQFESGLLFISFQKDVDQFTKIQTSLGATDKLNEYITHIGSGVFACFGGIREGEYIGQALFD